jgi:hypothetical protein
MPICIDRQELIRFFDDRPEVGRHAAAIKAVAGDELGLVLLVRYLHGLNQEAEVLRDGDELRRCTTGLSQGRRPYLDGWVTVEEGPSVIYYQVEVKSWSMHSEQGRQLSLDAPPEEVADFKRRRWERYWDAARHRFRDDVLNKVFTPMRCPDPKVRPRPLACLWDAVHETGGDGPMFDVAVPDHEVFQRVWVFSMSAYLRSLKDETLDLDLRGTIERLHLLDGLFLRPA